LEKLSKEKKTAPLKEKKRKKLHSNYTWNEYNIRYYGLILYWSCFERALKVVFIACYGLEVS